MEFDGRWERGEPLSGAAYGLPANKLCADGTPNLRKAHSAVDTDAALAAAGVCVPPAAPLAARRQTALGCRKCVCVDACISGRCACL